MLPLKTEFLFHLSLTVEANPHPIGAVPRGLRRITMINGGACEGPRIKGTVVPAATAAWVLDASGRILVSGTAYDSAGNVNMAAWRITAKRTLATTFNPTGSKPDAHFRTNTAGTGGYDFGANIAADSSGRILVAGNSFDSTGNDFMLVWRLTSSGTPDTSFGTGGFTAVGTTGQGAEASTMRRDSQNRFVVAGASC